MYVAVMVVLLLIQFRSLLQPTHTSHSYLCLSIPVLSFSPASQTYGYLYSLLTALYF